MREIDETIERVLRDAGLEWLPVVKALSERLDILEHMVGQQGDLLDLLAGMATAPEEEPAPKPQRVSLPPKANGRYCLWCGTPLVNKQRFFCSQADAGRWTGSHKGEKPEPLFAPPKEKETVVVAGEGVRE